MEEKIPNTEEIIRIERTGNFRFKQVVSDFLIEVIRDSIVSAKKYIEQIRITKEVIHSRNHSADVKELVKGVMIESYIEPGSQKVGEGVYGKSITDPCLGWEDSEKLLYTIADMLK